LYDEVTNATKTEEKLRFI